MTDLSLLRDLLVLVTFAVAVVAIGERFRLPSVAGFLLAGVAIGPNALGLISRSEDVRHLAEIGVVLLLFEIGLELSLSRIRRIWRAVVLGGGLQVTITLAATAAVAVVAGMSWPRAVVFGCLVALSSTAVVLKTLKDRRELETPHGRVSIGLLLFQDLAVVPLMVVVSLAGAGEGASVLASLSRVGLSLGVLVVVVLAAQTLVPRILAKVAGSPNRELFTLTVGLLGFGSAYVTASVGLSMAIGAFIAGLVISESDYGAQALSDVLPFRALFSGIFFTSIGMLLDPAFVWSRPGLVFGVTAAIMVGKAAIVAVVASTALRRLASTSVAAGLSLAQVGEFSFVLAAVASTSGVLGPADYQLFLAAAVISILLTPILIAGAPRLGRHASGLEREPKPPRAARDDAAAGLSDHAIIVGYGLAGRYLARVLRAAHIPYCVLEVDGQLVQSARHDGEAVAFGDGTRREVLEWAGITQARVVVFLISSAVDEIRGVSNARALNAEVRIVVRTRAVDAIQNLAPIGATDVVVEEFEATLELFQRVMTHYRIPSNTIRAELDAMRSEGYGILRGLPKEALNLHDLRFLGIHHALELVAVEGGSAAIGETAASLDLRRKNGVSVVAVVRDGESLYEFGPDFGFRADDVVVLVGPGPALVKGAAVFQAG